MADVTSQPPPPLRVHESFEAMDQARRERYWAMTPCERTVLLEEIRRAYWVEEYRNPPTELGPLKVLPCPWG